MARTLPIDAILPELVARLRDAGRVVTEAPPGAGKTTRVPVALIDAVPGRIVMLEPRRIAARAAAERMAAEMGEPVGQTVGYRIRGEAKVSRETRIEVVTEGVLTRRLQGDPGLEGVGAVIFDEFHERSLNADLGLALCLEVQAALRDDLAIVVMSATLDGAGVAALMGDAPVVRAEGRAYPVETRWAERPRAPGARVETLVEAAIRQAVADEAGGILAFLPGAGEIRRVMARLGDLPGCAVRPLYGALPFAEQRAAIRPEPGVRKVVLATAIAETSLTIEDISVVVDGGLARRARFDAASGMTRLVTEPVSRAEADQRRGRAGRVAEGVCYRVWAKAEEGALPAYPPAEIEVADVTGLALDLAAWGARHPSELPFLSLPPEGAWAEAVTLLADLGAVGADGAITAHGRQMAGLPVHPRLAHLLALAGGDGADLAALLEARDPMRDAGPDLARRLAAVARGDPGADRGALAEIRAEAKRLRQLAGGGDGRGYSAAEMAALAYPDRIGHRRPGDAPRWVLSGGKGAAMAPGSPMAAARLIVVTETDGDPREATIRQAVEISEAELRAVAGGRIGWVDVCHWSRREGRVIARRQERLGALVLEDRVWRDAPPDRVAAAMLEGVRQLGLTWTPGAARLRDRAMLARAAGADLPDMSDAALMATAEAWLLPHLEGVRSTGDWRGFDLTEALRLLIGWDGMQAIDRAVPAAFTTPLGRRVPIDYDGEVPGISVRLQEMFGVTEHPRSGGRPLRVTLLSPAGRPVQVTQDLPGFWADSYADVRKDMRGRYPKHPWPEDPTEAAPTLRAKPRGR